MTADITNIAFVLLTLLGQVLAGSNSSEISVCMKLSVRTHEKQCNPQLGEIMTQILAADGRNFTKLCRSVAEYVQCMEPFMVQCDLTHKSEYWQRKAVYTSEPYSCEPPVVELPETVSTDEGLTVLYTSTAPAMDTGARLRMSLLGTNLYILVWQMYTGRREHPM